MTNRTLKIEHVLTDLRSRGIYAENIQVVKNGVTCKGIRIIRDGNVSPVIYYSADDTYEAFMERIDAALEQDTPDFDVDILLNEEYLAKNLYLSVQRQSEEDIIKKPCLNLEICLRLGVDIADQAGSIKLTSSFLEMCGPDITEDDLWMWVIENTSHTFRIQSLAETIGIPCMDSPFDVITTTDGRDGAVALYYPDLLWRYCHQREWLEAYMLPSSKDELLIIDPESFDDPTYIERHLQDFAAMVQQINEAQVDPLIQLDPVVYRYDMIDNDFSVVAQAAEEVLV